MMQTTHSFLLAALLAASSTLVSGHACLWDEGMWGFNVTATTSNFDYDNRPVVPLMDFTFEKWWFHNHLDFPPDDGKFMELPAGGVYHGEVACDKGATSYYTSNPGGDIQDGNNPCPGSPTTAFHANNLQDVRGCALGITYNSDVSTVNPEDFVIFSTNHTCVWNRFTDFSIPADLPACPDEGCICSFNWIHAPDSGSEQIFMNGYRCKVTGSTSTKQLATPRLAQRCMGGALDDNNTPAPWNCTYGAKQALYWDQQERNTFFEGTYSPPFYNDLYAFWDGAQTDIFQDSDIPVFDENGEATGVTTLGAATVTTAVIVTPTISSGWPTTTPTIDGLGSAAATSVVSSASSVSVFTTSSVSESVSESTAASSSNTLVSSSSSLATSVVTSSSFSTTSSSASLAEADAVAEATSSSESVTTTAAASGSTGKCRTSKKTKKTKSKKRSSGTKRSGSAARAFGAHKTHAHKRAHADLEAMLF